MTKNAPREPKWDVLSLKTLRESSKAVFGATLKKRTLRTAYAEAFAALEARGKPLEYVCETCDSLVDEDTDRCWACGLVLSEEADGTEERIAPNELESRARKLGIDPEKLGDGVDLVSEIERRETELRASSSNSDLRTMESKRLNEEATERLPDGWRKRVSKNYVSYFDPGGTRRIAVRNRDLRVEFSVVDGFLDGFPNLLFHDASERKRRHAGRTNYVYAGDIYKTALDLVQRVFDEYTEK